MRLHIFDKDLRQKGERLPFVCIRHGEGSKVRGCGGCHENELLGCKVGRPSTPELPEHHLSVAGM